MDVAYPIGTGSKWQNNELRYSLRSLKNIVHDRVFIIGHKPEFVQNVIHIPFPDKHILKDSNIISKLLRVCYEDISEDFWFVSDDQLFLRPFPHEGELTIAFNVGEIKRGDSSWSHTKFNTADYLKRQGLPYLNYDTHTPQIINKHKYVEIMLAAPFSEGIGLLTNSYYFNVMAHNKLVIPTIPDKQKDFMMTYDTVSEDTKIALASLFPEVCEYEIINT